MTELTLLDSSQPEFPNPSRALTEPNGLLAVGGNLDLNTLFGAYQQGIFPWFSEDDPLLWWSPNPRSVIFPSALRVSKSLAKLQRQKRFNITANNAFYRVIESCQTAPRADAGGTWISDEMREAYCQLHDAGHAHSIEVWNQQRLVGGLYGVAVGAVFCGESMFSLVSNASKLALLALTEKVNGLALIDCQLPNPHLSSLGACEIPRAEFLKLLQKHGTTELNWPSDEGSI